MELKIVEQDFAICKVADFHDINLSDEYIFIGKTDEELSVVCLADCIPKNYIACERGWKAFRIQGVLDFSLIGILSKISSILAEAEIGIYAISTFNTDYILVKKESFAKALSALAAQGYLIR